MPICPHMATVATMQPSLSSAWILFVVPFASCGVLAHTRPLRTLSTRFGRPTRWIGLVGLAGFLAGVIGWLPVTWAVIAAAASGAFAGLSIFSVPPRDVGGEDESDDGGWGKPPPPEDEPPPPSGDGGELDWERFDSLRAQWERTPVLLP